MPRFDMIAFDCDGVLVDSEPLASRALAELLNELGWRISVEETMHAFIGRSIMDERAMIEERIGKPLPPDFYPEYTVRRDRLLEAEITPIRGIHETVQHFVRQQMPFCVASGAERAKMQLTLGRTGLLPWFEGKMFSGMEVARTKPAPDVYLLAAETMGMAPPRCVAIEDTVAGITAAVAAGMTVFGYAEHSDPRSLLAAGAVQVFDDMAQLPELVLR